MSKQATVFATIRCPQGHWLADIWRHGDVLEFVRTERLPPAFIAETDWPVDEPMEETRQPVDSSFLPVVVPCRCRGKLWIIGRNAAELHYAATTVRPRRSVALSNGLRVVRPTNRS